MDLLAIPTHDDRLPCNRKFRDGGLGAFYLLATIHGASPRVSAGNGLFTLLGFMGLYMIKSQVNQTRIGDPKLKSDTEARHARYNFGTAEGEKEGVLLSDAK